jgi:hypothetical protein
MMISPRAGRATVAAFEIDEQQAAARVQRQVAEGIENELPAKSGTVRQSSASPGRNGLPRGAERHAERPRRAGLG